MGPGQSQRQGTASSSSARSQTQCSNRARAAHKQSQSSWIISIPLPPYLEVSLGVVPRHVPHVVGHAHLHRGTAIWGGQQVSLAG